jgi:hypothetical protein
MQTQDFWGSHWDPSCLFQSPLLAKGRWHTVQANFTGAFSVFGGGSLLAGTLEVTRCVLASWYWVGQGLADPDALETREREFAEELRSPKAAVVEGISKAKFWEMPESSAGLTNGPFWDGRFRLKEFSGNSSWNENDELVSTAGRYELW